MTAQQVSKYMTWEKIAEKTGYSQSPDYPRLHIRDEYLKKSDIK